MTIEPLLSVEGLSVAFPAWSGWVNVTEDIWFDVGPAETVGLVGESGSGKTVTMLALLGLIAGSGGRITAGSVRFDGTDLTRLSARELERVRGNDIGMIFQQPIRSLNPAYTVGDQIAEVIRQHERCGRKAAWSRAVSGLDRVGIANAAKRAKDYPHQFSGGMCQRVMIAMALACNPRLLIADEPTTALDVTVQAKILELILEIQREQALAVVFISHDLGVIAEVCDRVVVMYAGEVVETGTAVDLYTAPKHPYTAGLMHSIPRPGVGTRLVAIDGAIPSLGRLPSGCRFHPRCPHCVTPTCTEEPIELAQDAGRRFRCARADEIHLDGVFAR